MFPYNIHVNKLDLRGLTCPAPVVETKKLLDEERVDEIEVLLDNDMAIENVTRFLTSHGFSVELEKTDKQEGGALKGKRTAEPGTETAAPAAKLLIYISTAYIGRGDDELGRVLMSAFLNTLKGLDTVPWRIILINGGVTLAAEGSDFVGSLRALEGLGAEVLACGTCVDFYHLKEKLAVGRISNMHEIASSFLEASNVISP